MDLFRSNSFLFSFLPRTHMTDTLGLNIAIESFIRDNLYPTQKERDFVSEKYQELRDILPTEFSIFQSGSYARKTANTPIGDLDIICDSDNPQESIPVLYKLLEEAYRWKARVKLQTHSIGIYFWEDDEFSIDVVPVKKAIDLPRNEFWDSLYELPDFLKYSKSKRKDLYEWNATSHSDPKWYISQAIVVDRESDGRFKRAVKFLKRWNYWMKKDVNNDEFKSFKSFHIEEIIKKFYMEIPELELYEVIFKFFQEWMNFLERPQFPDRAGVIIGDNFFVDQYIADDISDTDKALIKSYLEKWVTLMGLLMHEDDIDATLKAILFMNPIKKPAPKQIIVPRTSWPAFVNF